MSNTSCQFTACSVLKLVYFFPAGFFFAFAAAVAFGLAAFDAVAFLAFGGAAFFTVFLAAIFAVVFFARLFGFLAVAELALRETFFGFTAFLPVLAFAVAALGFFAAGVGFLAVAALVVFAFTFESLIFPITPFPVVFCRSPFSSPCFSAVLRCVLTELSS